MGESIAHRLRRKEPCRESRRAEGKDAKHVRTRLISTMRQYARVVYHLSSRQLRCYRRMMWFDAPLVGCRPEERDIRMRAIFREWFILFSLFDWSDCHLIHQSSLGNCLTWPIALYHEAEIMRKAELPS